MNKKKLLLTIGVIIVVIAAVTIYTVTNKGGNNQQASLYNIASSKTDPISDGIYHSIPSSKTDAISDGLWNSINNINTGEPRVQQLPRSSTESVTTGAISMNSTNGSFAGTYTKVSNNVGKRFFAITPVTISNIGGGSVITAVNGPSIAYIIDNHSIGIPNGTFTGGYSGSLNGYHFAPGTSYDVRACMQEYTYNLTGAEGNRTNLPACGQGVLVTIPAAAAAIAPASGTLGQTCASWLQGTNYRTSFTGSNVMARSTYDPAGYGATNSSANSCAYLTPGNSAANHCSMKSSTFSSSSSYPTSGCSNTFVANQAGSKFNGEPITQSFTTTVQ